MEQVMNRRQFLQNSSVAAAVTASLTASSQGSAQEGSAAPVRIGVVGLGPRGRWHIRNLLEYQKGVTVPAVCDYQTDRAALTVDLVKKLKGYAPETYTRGDKDYLRMLERNDLDGIIVATDVYTLGKISIACLKAGKHVGIEIAGCHTIEECHGLVEEYERSRRQCMLLENCCYGDDNMTVVNMLKQGLFGEPYFSVGSYVHDCRDLFFDAQGKITWRGELWRDAYGSSYPQHGLGSACKWLAINDGDRMEYCQAMMTTPLEAHAWAVKRFGPDSAAARVNFKTGDFVTTLISTAKGRNIRIDYSLSNTRPYSRYYLLQGMNGCWDSLTGIHLRGNEPSQGEAWAPLAGYKPKYQHRYWRKDGELARQSGGHEGIDFFCIYDFVQMVRSGKTPWIDAYDAASWSSLIHCTRLSLDRAGARVEMPDFTGGRWKDPEWRKAQQV